MDAREFAAFAKEQETWLMRRILMYARARDYTKYTSTLEEAWRASISGLTESFGRLAEMQDEIPELGPDDTYDNDPATSFGLTEARKHRSRGVALPMFLGLMKYYRQAYLDLAAEESCREGDSENVSLYVSRFFDRVELAFIAEWSGVTSQANLTELMDSNRLMTNEKNLYLTVFESIMSPVVLLDPDHTVINMNRAASRLFRGEESPGSVYYSGSPSTECLPWLKAELGTFVAGGERDWIFDKELATPNGIMVYQVCLSKMLDVSEKFKGTVVIMEDITEKTNYAKQLAYFAEHDMLTGLCNRRVLEGALKRTVERAKRGACGVFIYMDVDNLKSVNDGYGHQEGDRLLKRVAEVIATNARGTDVCARLGGDEFAVLLDDTTVDEALVVADRIKNALSPPDQNRGDVGVSISAGVVAIDGAVDYLSIMSRGDGAMYLAKSKGRNQIVAA
jgi:diguanylate cyclase